MENVSQFNGSIVLAETGVHNHSKAIFVVFEHRGMGVFQFWQQVV